MKKAIFLGLKNAISGKLFSDQPYDIGTVMFVTRKEEIHGLFPWEVVKCDKYPQLEGGVLADVEISLSVDEIKIEDWL